MDLSQADYLAQLQALLPPGAAWSREPDAVLTQLLSGLAQELARVDDRGKVLVAQLDPRTADEMLLDWERLLGLPDVCASSATTTQERRVAAYAKLTAQGGASPQYFIALAAALGFAVTITEFEPHNVDQDVDADLLGPAWRFAWQVNAPSVTIRELDVTGAVDDPLASWGNDLLVCAIQRTAPAHTVVIFAYNS